MKLQFFILLLCFNLLNNFAHADECMVKKVNVCHVIAEGAREKNATLPKTVGNITFVKVTTDKKQISYHYTVNYSLKEAAKKIVSTPEKIKLKQEEMVKIKVCAEESSLSLLKDGAKLIFIYTYQDGMVNQFSITECPNVRLS